MKAFRASMNIVHTWAGIICGALLFAMFWMGTLSVFDREIDLWMKPELRGYSDQSIELANLDQALRPMMENLAEDGIRDAYAVLPKERDPVLKLYHDTPEGDRIFDCIDLASGDLITPTESEAGTEFIYPFHFSFHIEWQGLGYWIAGFCAMAMLVLMVSGIFIHRKIIKDFFTFRPEKKLRRSTLDLHNLSSVVALPFHFFLPFTGLLIFFSIYLSWAVALPFGGDTEPLFQEMYGTRSVELSGTAQAPSSLAQMAEAAQTLWRVRYGEDARPDGLQIVGWGDAAAEFTFRRVFPSREMSMDKDALTFSASGAVLQDFTAKPVRQIHAWLSGLHFIQFDHWALRWLYFAAGLSGCVMIATGMLFWMRTRTARDGTEPLKVRAVHALTVGSVTGIIIATAAFLIANRLLAQDAALLGQSRAALEIWAFFIVWLASFLHAALSGKSAWVHQSWAISVFGIAAVLLNWMTTGDHIIAALQRGLWPIAGMDVVILCGAVVAIMSALGVERYRAKTDKIDAPSGLAETPAE